MADMQDEMQKTEEPIKQKENGTHFAGVPGEKREEEKCRGSG